MSLQTGIQIRGDFHDPNLALLRICWFAPILDRVSATQRNETVSRWALLETNLEFIWDKDSE
jgi:hypothetical protein